MTLPNFGEERGIAETIKRSGLDVPILIQAEEDIAGQMNIDAARLLLRQDQHLQQPAAGGYCLFPDPIAHGKGHLARVQRGSRPFAAVCRIVRGLKNVRLGAIGSRPAAFNTVRYSEKILEYAGIGVEPVDLYEIWARLAGWRTTTERSKPSWRPSPSYTDTQAIPAEGLLKMAKFGTVIDQWIKEKQLPAPPFSAGRPWRNSSASCRAR